MSIFDYAQNYGIPPGDLTKTNSYGYIKRNGNDDIVLIDYGLDADVFSTHYFFILRHLDKTNIEIIFCSEWSNILIVIPGQILDAAVRLSSARSLAKFGR